MTIKAIETRFAGCRFRSRLEARWAVFFDHLNIRWEYEPQGLKMTHRLTLDEGEFPYLPDFWLPGLELWAEVKGSLTPEECVRLLDAAAHLSSNGGGGCHDSGGHDVVLFGPVPRIGRIAEWSRAVSYTPWRLHMHKGDLSATGWLPGTRRESPGSECPGLGSIVACDVGGSLDRIVREGDFQGDIIDHLLRGCGIVFDDLRSSIDYGMALAAARSARFEHGESG